MAEIYKWLADYYTRKGDKENAANILLWENRNIQMIFFMMKCNWMS